MTSRGRPGSRPVSDLSLRPLSFGRRLIRQSGHRVADATITGRYQPADEQITTSSPWRRQFARRTGALNRQSANWQSTAFPLRIPTGPNACCDCKMSTRSHVPNTTCPSLLHASLDFPFLLRPRASSFYVSITPKKPRKEVPKNPSQGVGRAVHFGYIEGSSARPFLGAEARPRKSRPA